jgi:hypothetical protein
MLKSRTFNNLVSFEYARRKLNFLNDHFPIYGVLKADLGRMRKGEKVRLVKLWGSGYEIAPAESDHSESNDLRAVVVSGAQVDKYFERR